MSCLTNVTNSLCVFKTLSIFSFNATTVALFVERSIQTGEIRVLAIKQVVTVPLPKTATDENVRGP